MFTFWFATIVFFGTYFLIATEKVHKTTAALVGASLMLFVVLQGPGHGSSDHEDTIVMNEAALTVPEQVKEALKDESIQLDNEEAQYAEGGAEWIQAKEINPSEAYNKLDVYACYVNFDVIFTLAGMMVLVNILSGTGVFQYIAIKCAKLAKGSPIRTMILLVFATATLSAFLDNVTTVLLVAPVTLLVCAELAVNPIPFLMAECMASNIGGTATLIGDPPNLIIGSYANLDFSAFLINLAIFIFVILVLYCVYLKLYYGKRMHVTIEQRARIMELDEKAAITDPVNMKRGGTVVLLTICGFLLHGALGFQPCMVAMGGAAAALAVCKVNVDHALEKIEWSTLFFFLGLFILVNGAEQAGLMHACGKIMSFMSDWPVLLIILVLMWFSGIAAAITNNVSYTAAMVSVVGEFLNATPSFASNLELQHLVWWGLALAICLGGNGTLVGAAANLVTVNIAAKNGHEVSFKHFLIYGGPTAFTTLVAASIYIAVRYFVCF